MSDRISPITGKVIPSRDLLVRGAAERDSFREAMRAETAAIAAREAEAESADTYVPPGTAPPPVPAEGPASSSPGAPSAGGGSTPVQTVAHLHRWGVVPREDVRTVPYVGTDGAPRFVPEYVVQEAYSAMVDHHRQLYGRQPTAEEAAEFRRRAKAAVDRAIDTDRDAQDFLWKGTADRRQQREAALTGKGASTFGRIIQGRYLGNLGPIDVLGDETLWGKLASAAETFGVPGAETLRSIAKKQQEVFAPFDIAYAVKKVHASDVEGERISFASQHPGLGYLDAGPLSAVFSYVDANVRGIDMPWASEEHLRATQDFDLSLHLTKPGTWAQGVLFDHLPESAKVGMAAASPITYFGGLLYQLGLMEIAEGDTLVDKSLRGAFNTLIWAPALLMEPDLFSISTAGLGKVVKGAKAVRLALAATAVEDTVGGMRLPKQVAERLKNAADAVDEAGDAVTPAQQNELDEALQAADEARRAAVEGQGGGTRAAIRSELYTAATLQDEVGNLERAVEGATSSTARAAPDPDEVRRGLEDLEEVTGGGLNVRPGGASERVVRDTLASRRVKVTKQEEQVRILKAAVKEATDETQKARLQDLLDEAIKSAEAAPKVAADEAKRGLRLRAERTLRQAQEMAADGLLLFSRLDERVSKAANEVRLAEQSIENIERANAAARATQAAADAATAPLKQELAELLPMIETQQELRALESGVSKARKAAQGTAKTSAERAAFRKAQAAFADAVEEAGGLLPKAQVRTAINRTKALRKDIARATNKIKPEDSAALQALKGTLDARRAELDRLIEQRDMARLTAERTVRSKGLQRTYRTVAAQVAAAQEVLSDLRKAGKQARTLGDTKLAKTIAAREKAAQKNLEVLTARKDAIQAAVDASEAAIRHMEDTADGFRAADMRLAASNKVEAARRHARLDQRLEDISTAFRRVVYSGAAVADVDRANVVGAVVEAGGTHLDDVIKAWKIAFGESRVERFLKSSAPGARALRSGKWTLNPGRLPALRKIEEALRRDYDMALVQARTIDRTLRASQKPAEGIESMSVVRYAHTINNMIGRVEVGLDGIASRGLGVAKDIWKRFYRNAYETFKTSEVEFEDAIRYGGRTPEGKALTMDETLDRLIYTNDVTINVGKDVAFSTNLGSAPPFDQAMNLLKLLADGEGFQDNVVAKAIAFAYMPAARMGREVAGQSLAAVRAYAKEGDFSRESFEALLERLRRKALTIGPIKVEQARTMITRAIVAGSTQQEALRAALDLRRGAIPLPDQSTVRAIQSFMHGAGELPSVVSEALESANKANEPALFYRQLSERSVGEVERALGDMGGIYRDRAMTQMGEGLLPIFSAMGESMDLLKVVVDEGNELWMPVNVYRALNEIPRSLAKEITQVSDTPSGLGGLVQGFARWSTQSLVVGAVGIPRLSFLGTTAIGDMMSALVNIGGGAMTRSMTNSVVNGIPFIGSRLQNGLLRLKDGMPSLPILFHDEGLLAVFNADPKAIVKTLEGDVPAQQFLRECIQDGAQDSMPTQTIVEMFNRLRRMHAESLREGSHLARFMRTLYEGSGESVARFAKMLEREQFRKRVATLYMLRTGSAGKPVPRELAAEKMRLAFIDWSLGTSAYEAHWLGAFNAFWAYKRGLMTMAYKVVEEAGETDLARFVFGQNSLGRLRLAVKGLDKASASMNEPYAAGEDVEAYEAAELHQLSTLPSFRQNQPLLRSTFASEEFARERAGVTGRPFTYRQVFLKGVDSFDMLTHIMVPIAMMHTAFDLATGTDLEASGQKMVRGTQMVDDIITYAFDTFLSHPVMDDKPSKVAEELVKGLFGMDYDEFTLQTNADRGVPVPKKVAVLMNKLGLEDHLTMAKQVRRAPDGQLVFMADAYALRTMVSVLAALPQAQYPLNALGYYARDEEKETQFQAIMTAFGQALGLVTVAESDASTWIDRRAQDTLREVNNIRSGARDAAYPYQNKKYNPDLRGR